MDTTVTHNFNDDEIGLIVAFMHPRDLLTTVQLVSKNFQQVVLTNDNYWKKYCQVYFHSDFFNWPEDLPFQVDKSDELSCYHFKLFYEWSKSIPRIAKVGRLPIISNFNGGSEHERSIFTRYDTSKYSPKHLQHLIILLNVFSLTKNGKYFYEYLNGRQHFSDLPDYYEETDDSVFAIADFIPYDFVPSIWGDFVSICLSDKNNSQHEYGFALIEDESNSIIHHNLPFGAFCLMILSPNQSEKIKLVETLLQNQLPDETTHEESEDDDPEYEYDPVLSVSFPNPTDLSEDGVVSYFNSMHKDFHETHWTDDKEREESWLPCSQAGFISIFTFREYLDLKQVSMDRCYYYP